MNTLETAKRIVAVSKREQPNKHLVLMSHRYKEQSKGQECTYGREFVSGVRYVMGCRATKWIWLIIPTLILIIDAISIATDTKMTTPPEWGCYLIVGVISLVWSIIFMLMKFANFKGNDAVIAVATAEEITGRTIDQWDNEYNPCEVIQQHLKELARSVKMREVNDHAFPWEPALAPSKRFEFGKKLDLISQILPIKMDNGFYFSE